MNNMTTSVVFSFLLPLIFSVASAEDDKREHALNPGTTAINGITIVSTEREIVSRLGTPQSVKSGYSEVLAKPSKKFHYDGITIDVIGGDIYKLSCAARRCLTDRGVKVGDRKSKVIRVYGAGDRPSAGAERDTLIYPLRGYDSYLSFVFQNGVVTAIELWVDYT